jgi:hypothetical protein
MSAAGKIRQRQPEYLELSGHKTKAEQYLNENHPI